MLCRRNCLPSHFKHSCSCRDSLVSVLAPPPSLTLLLPRHHRQAKADAGVRALECPCLSAAEGSMSTHRVTPPPPPPLTLCYFEHAVKSLAEPRTAGASETLHCSLESRQDGRPCERKKKNHPMRFFVFFSLVD